MAIYKGNNKVIALYKGDKKVIRRYKGTQIVFESKTSTNEVIATDNNTVAFKYLINDLVTTSNVFIDNTPYTFDASNGESLGNNYYKATITPTDTIKSIKFVSGNLYELYELPNSLTSMSGMFASCSHNLYFNLKDLNTSNVNAITNCFANLSLVGDNTADIVIDVRGWDISNITIYNQMFLNSNKIQKLILGDVTQTEYDWWSARLNEAGITPTIEYTIV